MERIEGQAAAGGRMRAGQVLFKALYIGLLVKLDEFSRSLEAGETAGELRRAGWGKDGREAGGGESRAAAWAGSRAAVWAGSQAAA